MPGILPGHLDSPTLRTSNATGFGYSPDGNDAANAGISHLLLAAARTEAFRHKLAMLSIEAQRRLALHPSHCSADQPRTAATINKTESERLATSEVTPDSKPTSAPDSRLADKGAPPSASQ
jgi:hypothetical protein